MRRIELLNIDKSYQKGTQVLPVLRNVSLTVEAGEFITLLGKSGSGKSTLLNIIGLLDCPDSGRYQLLGQDTDTGSERKLAQLRNRHFGFVFQSYNLLPFKTAAENVMLPLFYRGTSRRDAMKLANEMLERIGIGHRATHLPFELSGGECQRVAIARALVGQPDILLADEPTGALDSVTGADILELFKELNDEGLTIILITHDPSIASRAHSVYRVHDGILKPVDYVPQP